MANKAISELTDGGAPQAGDEVPIVRSGANYRAALGTMAGEDSADYVAGSASSTDNAVVRWDGTGGNQLQNSSVTIDDTGVITTAAGYRAGTGSVSAVSYSVEGSDNGLYSRTSSTVGVVVSGNHRFEFTGSSLKAGSGCSIGWTSGTAPSASIDTGMYRDAAATIGVRSGTTATSTKFYNTYTDSSNYERVGLNWSGNIANLVSEAAGTGTVREMRVNNVTVTKPATNAILTLADGSTLATSGAYSTTLTATGATNVTLPTSGTLATTSNPTFTTGITTPQVTFNSTSGIIGTTTNDSAAAGSVGELLSSLVTSGSAVSLTSNTDANVTSLSLTAGDWDVWFDCNFSGGATTQLVWVMASISATSATMNTTPGFYFGMGVNATGTSTIFNSGINYVSASAGAARISLASTTTYYAVAKALFTVSTCSAFGLLRARRVR